MVADIMECGRVGPGGVAGASAGTTAISTAAEDAIVERAHPERRVVLSGAKADAWLQPGV